MDMFQGAALALALCLDSFAAALALSAAGIHVSLLSGSVINGISAVLLAVSLAAGRVLRPVLPQGAARYAGFLLLAGLGLTRLLDSAIKELIRRSQTGSASISFRFLSFDCVLRVFADSTAADADRSQALTPGEAIPLAAALSLDSLAAGAGAGMASLALSPVMMALLAFFSGSAFMGLGCALGRRFKSSGPDLSWLGGIVLLLLAVSRLL